VTWTGLVEFAAGQVPVHDVPAAGAEPELDRGRVHDHVVVDGDITDELRQRVRAAVVVKADPLQPGPRREDRDHALRSERWHRRTIGVATGRDGIRARR
jgi:hypothetical protein